MSADFPDYEFLFSTKKDCDLRNPAATLAFVERSRPDAILNLAAVSGGVALSRNYPATLLRDNVLMTINVLEAARCLEVGKTVMTLSSGMYPPDAPLPITEASIHCGPAHESNYSYAYAKRLIEPAIRAYRAEFGVHVIGLVPNGIFGEYDNFDFATSSMPSALMRRFYEARDHDSPIVVWGDGSPVRELTYGKDMARAFMWCLVHYDCPEILNVGTSEEHSVKEIAFMIAEELGIDARRIGFEPSKPGGVQRKSTDTSRFRQISQFEFTPFRIGLRNTISWLATNYGAVVQSGRVSVKPHYI